MAQVKVYYLVEVEVLVDTDSEEVLEVYEYPEDLRPNAEANAQNRVSAKAIEIANHADWPAWERSF